MPKFILLTTLTGDGASTLHANPDRIMQVDKEMESFGCKVEAQYAVLGDIDFVTIIDAPDNETVAHLSADMASRGTVRVRSLPLIEIETLIARMKMPHKMGRAHISGAAKALHG